MEVTTFKGSYGIFSRILNFSVELYERIYSFVSFVEFMSKRNTIMGLVGVL